MIKSTQYLYGCNANEFADLPYKEALQFKYNKANALAKQLVQPHYSKQDFDHQNAVWSARSHCQALLDELKESL